MTAEEFRVSLLQVWKDVKKEDHALQLEELQRTVDFLRNDNEQKEIEIIRLQTRLAEVRNILNGANE